MIRTLDRYVAARTAAAIALAWLGLVAVFSLIRFGQELRDVGTGRYGVAAATHFVVRTVPAEAARLLTPAVLVGTASAIGDLAAHNETIALAACGISRLRLLAVVLQVVGVASALGLVLADGIAAPLAQRAHADRALALSEGRALATSSGLWARDGESFVNIRGAPSTHELRGVSVYRFDAARRLEAFVHADAAVWRDGAWLLHGAVEGRLGPSGLETHRPRTRRWETSLVPRQVALLDLPVADLSTADLHGTAAALERRGENAGRHRLALWSRLVQPLAAAALATVAVGFFLRAGVRTRAGARVVAAALAGVGFQIADGVLARGLLLSGVPPLLAAAAPSLLVLAGGFVWLGRGSRRLP